jgi:ABC-type antimicrobial peptide transport system permease subunit
VAYTVSQRTHEIGIRIALGADTRQVRRSVLRRTLAPVSAGILAGLFIAYVVGGLLRPLLYGLSPSDPITLGGMTLVLLGVAAVACYLPARRASRMDPIAALRWE